MERVAAKLGAFDDYQGRALDYDDADAIAELQKDFLVGALRGGIADMRDFEDGSLPTDHKLYRAFSGIKLLKQFVQSDAAFYLKIQSIGGFYQDVHEFLEIDDDGDKLFLEFLLGLLRFEVVSQMSLSLAGKIDEDFQVDTVQSENENGEGFFGSLKGPEEALNQVYSRVISTLGPEAADFWQRIEHAIKSDPAFEAAAKALLRLHYLPDDKRIMSMAQVLHWKGFGGGGEILKLFPELEPLSRQSIVYHDGLKSSDMNDRISWFAQVMGVLKLRSIGTLSKVLGKLFPDRAKIRIFDSGSGDKLAAVSGLRAYMPAVKLSVTAADVAGESLRKLCGFNESQGGGSLSVDKVVYQDLGGELDAGEERDSYDVFSAGNVLHHLIDRQSGEQNLAKVMRFAAGVVRTGGVVYLQDVGEAAYLQFPVIPGNLVDREGCLPPNIYERLSFESVAAGADPGFVKIPCRLSRLWAKGPDNLASGRGIYETNFYIVVRIPEKELRNLDELRGRGKFAECDEIIQNYFDIAGLQQQVLEKTRAACA